MAKEVDMEEIWNAYVGLLSWQTYIPAAFIISTAIGFIYYAIEDEIGAAIGIGIASLVGAFLIILLFSVCSATPFPGWWKVVSNVLSMIIWVFIFLSIVGLVAKQSEGAGCFVLVFLIVAGVFVYKYVARYTFYYVFYFFGKFILFPLIKYLIGYGLYHGIFSIGIPGFIIAAIVIMVQEIDDCKPALTIFLYAVFIGLAFFARPIASGDVELYVYHFLGFLAPFVIASIILMHNRSKSLWIISFLILLVITQSQTWFFFRSFVEYRPRFEKLDSPYPVINTLIYFILTCVFSFLYFWKLCKVGEVNIHKKNDLRILWMFSAILINVFFLAPLILGYYSINWIAIFSVLSIVTGSAIVTGRVVLRQQA